jgi:Ca2+-transporting ATPase
MSQRPRPAAAPLLDRQSLRFVIIAGSVKAALALTLLGAVPVLGYELPQARAAVFHFMAVGQLLLTYPSRHTLTRPLPNPYLHAAVAGGILVQIGAAALPLTSMLLGNIAMPLQLWLIVGGWSLATLAIAEWIARSVWTRPAA